MEKTKICMSITEQYGLPLKEQLKLLRKIGFDAYFFEWKPNLDVKDLKNYGDELGLICQSMHAPFTKMADMWEEGEKAEFAVSELLQCVDDCAKKAGTTINVVDYVCFERGEGVEKKEDNFADEVASMIK